MVIRIRCKGIARDDSNAVAAVDSRRVIVRCAENTDRQSGRVPGEGVTVDGQAREAGVGRAVTLFGNHHDPAPARAARYRVVTDRDVLKHGVRRTGIGPRQQVDSRPLEQDARNHVAVD